MYFWYKNILDFRGRIEHVRRKSCIFTIGGINMSDKKKLEIKKKIDKGFYEGIPPIGREHVRRKSCLFTIRSVNMSEKKL